MPSPAFISALPFVLRWEGGFVDRPDDPGGRTNRGITQAVYNDWRVKKGLPAADVASISDADVNAIYEANYWLPPRCEALGNPLALVQFDTAVNMGVRRAVRLLQTAIDCPVDGAFGSGTLKAFESCNRTATVTRYCDEREAYYRRLAVSKPDLAVFLKGWLNRLNALRRQVGVPGFETAPGTRSFDVAPTFRISDDAAFDA
jgi:lysozyme family protein